MDIITFNSLYFQNLNYTYAIIFFLVVISVSLIVIKLRKRSEIEIIHERLDNRDLMILEAIKRGYKTLTEISSYTKLPKSTTYRRLKKLTELGYLTNYREYGKVYLSLIHI